MLFIIILLSFCISIAKANDNRIYVNARINNKPVRLMVDTGTTAPLALYSTTADKLSIHYNSPSVSPSQGFVNVGQTDPCVVYMPHDILGTDTNLFFYDKMPVPVINILPNENLPEDGIVGWPAFRNGVFSIDAFNDKISSGTAGLLKGDGWQTFQLDTNLDILGFDVPIGKGTNVLLLLDTGSIFGIELNSGSHAFGRPKISESKRAIQCILLQTAKNKTKEHENLIKNIHRRNFILHSCRVAITGTNRSAYRNRNDQYRRHERPPAGSG
jgi:hypothetical protein